jgi:diguanylate cyclase (GGDEF)-like protein
VLLCGTALAGLAVFYGAMRSGWSKRCADPALTSVQMGFSFVLLGLSYIWMTQVRGPQLVMTPLVLMFGAFTLTPRQCRLMGLSAIVAQGLAIVLTIEHQTDGQQIAAGLITLGSSVVIFAMAADMAGRLSAIREQLRVQKRALHAALERNALLARQDDLTELPNRRHAIEMMEYEERRAQRDKIPPAICMLDIDHFKRINDTHGHAAGDEVLRLMAKRTVGALRSPDILARWGGEEFILLMPETSLPEAVHVIERLHLALSQLEVWQLRPELKVTFSCGIATLKAGESIQNTVARADAALYLAKQQGRNRTVQAIEEDADAGAAEVSAFRQSHGQMLPLAASR